MECSKRLRNISLGSGSSGGFNGGGNGKKFGVLAVILIVSVSYLAGFGTYAAIQYGISASSLAIGGVSGRDELDVGDWLRYDYKYWNAPDGQSKYYVIATVTGTYPVDMSNNPVVATALGVGARDYIWDISIYSKTNNATVTLAQVKAADATAYMFVRTIVEANSPSIVASTSRNAFMTTTNASLTARVVLFNQDKGYSTFGAYMYLWYYPGGSSVGSYIVNVWGWMLAQSEISFEKQSGIMLHASATGFRGYQDAGLFLSSSSKDVANQPEPPAKPTLSLIDGNTVFTKKLIVTNYDPATMYITRIAFFESGTSLSLNNIVAEMPGGTLNIVRNSTMHINIEVNVIARKNFIDVLSDNEYWIDILFGGSGSGTPSATLQVGTIFNNVTAPTKPSTMTISYSAGNITWSAVVNATEYRVYYYNATTPVTLISLLRQANITTSFTTSFYTNDSLPNGMFSVYVTVKTLNCNGESDPSNIVSVSLAYEVLALTEPPYVAPTTSDLSNIGIILVPVIVIVIVAVIVVYIILRARNKPTVGKTTTKASAPRATHKK